MCHRESNATEVAGECTRIKLNGWSLKMEERFYLGETLHTKLGTLQVQEKLRVDKVSSEI